MYQYKFTHFFVVPFLGVPWALVTGMNLHSLSKCSSHWLCSRSFVQPYCLLGHGIFLNLHETMCSYFEVSVLCDFLTPILIFIHFFVMQLGCEIHYLIILFHLVFTPLNRIYLRICHSCFTYPLYLIIWVQFNH